MDSRITTSPAPAFNILLTRLANVHACGSGWRADCPCGHRSKGTLSITASERGNVLLHCFAGCEPHDILACFGLEVADLFPERIADSSPEARRTAQEAFRRNGWAAALGVLLREATVVLCAVAFAKRGEMLTDEDQERLDLAAEHIASAREVLHGR